MNMVINHKNKQNLNSISIMCALLLNGAKSLFENVYFKPESAHVIAI